MRSTALIVVRAAGLSGCGSSYEQQQLERQQRLQQVLAGAQSTEDFQRFWD